MKMIVALVVGSALTALGMLLAIAADAAWVRWIFLSPLAVLTALVPHPNIGTPEHPFYEGTPLDLPAATVVIQAFPPAVFVDERGVHIPERPDHNVLQLSPGDIKHKSEPVRCSVDVKVPLDVVEFQIAVSVFREGFSATTRNFRFGSGRRLRAGKN